MAGGDSRIFICESGMRGWFLNPLMHQYNRTARRVLALGVVSLMVAVVACSSDAGQDGGGGGGPSIRHTTAAGETDTVRLSASVAVAVDNSTATIPVTLDLQVPPDTGMVKGSAVLGSALLHVTGLAEGRRAGANVRLGVGIPVLTTLITVAHQVAGDIRSFLVESTDPAALTPFWTTPTATDFVDPRDGQLKTIEAVTLVPNAGGSADYLIKLADLSEPCAPGPRLVDVDPGHAGDGRIPLILIHGWQYDMVDCDDYASWDTDGNHSPFEAILASLDADTVAAGVTLRQRYHPYVFHYPTYQSVIRASEMLDSDLAALPGGPPVIVAHSMGGLVARAMFGLSGAPQVRGLVTIGTPHAGAPIAAMFGPDPTVSEVTRALDAAACRISGAAVSVAAPLLLAPTAGLGDLAPGSPLIQSLVANRPAADRIYTLGGKITALDLNHILNPKDAITFTGTDCLSRLIDGGEATDGVVPPSSALPSWSAGQWLVSAADHLQLPQSSSVVALVDTVLSRWSHCTTPPMIGGTNAFPLSGSFGREPGGTVDVTINGIVINGVVQTNLPASDFTIVENGCAIPAGDVVVTTGEGHVGVDLAFVQDLSGSMDNVIAGVRSSVNTFVSGLTAQGFDVRIGSVGYSGFVSHIPSTPAGSLDEYLGPFQDLTTVAGFQQHVSSQWASGGGSDNPENGLEAIEYVMNHLTWRPGAVSVLVDITNSSHHTAGDSCDNLGPCTDETLGTITELLSGRAVLHAVAPADAPSRTQDGGLDPWLIATATGGKDLVLGNGIFDLNAIGLSSAIAATTRLTFRSASPSTAPDNLRILVTINGQTSELAPGLVTYRMVPPSLRHRAQ